jgi:hypothetical protein
MKKYLSTFAGSAICGGFAFGIWPELWKTYGLMGGWLAATLIIGIMWYMNHYHGAILNPPGKIWLDHRFCRNRLGNCPLSGRYHQLLLCGTHLNLLSDRRCSGRNTSMENPFVRLCPEDKLRRKEQ